MNEITDEMREPIMESDLQIRNSNHRTLEPLAKDDMNGRKAVMMRLFANSLGIVMVILLAGLLAVLLLALGNLTSLQGEMEKRKSAGPATVVAKPQPERILRGIPGTPSQAESPSAAGRDEQWVPGSTTSGLPAGNMPVTTPGGSSLPAGDESRPKSDPGPPPPPPGPSEFTM